MKLLQTMAGGDVGGAEEFFVRLAAALDRQGFEQRLIVRPNQARNGRLRESGIPVVELPFGGVLDRRTAPGIAAEVEGFAPDVAMSWMSRASAATGNALRRVRRTPVLLGRLGGYYNLKYYAGCDHLIGNTPDVVSYVASEGWPGDRAHFVPNFVHADTGRPVPRATLDVPEETPLLFAAGRLHPNKAFDVLLGALKRLPEAHLMIAGEGEAARDLLVLAHKLGVAGRVHFLGWRSDVADLMATADMLVCPSRIEPLGNVVIEAWARRLPVVAAAAAGPAWLIEDGTDGLLVPVDDAEALAAAVGRLAAGTELAVRLAEGGRARFEAEFTEDAVVRHFVELFEKVRR